MYAAIKIIRTLVPRVLEINRANGILLIQWRQCWTCKVCISQCSRWSCLQISDTTSIATTRALVRDEFAAIDIGITASVRSCRSRMLEHMKRIDMSESLRCRTIWFRCSRSLRRSYRSSRSRWKMLLLRLGLTNGFYLRHRFGILHDWGYLTFAGSSIHLGDGGGGWFVSLLFKYFWKK